MTSADSARHEGDTWDLASSVGATATLVATTRAMATRADQPLINDPFAEPLVRAVGVDVLARLATGELAAADLDTNGVGSGMQRMVDSIAVRTKFFDEFFLDATQSGIRQAVILACGLDARAYRLPWPSGTTVYEIDQPQVIEFKSRVLAELGATPTAHRRTVAIDLREDWPTALRAAGFDPGQPTAWSAEGLLGYLSPQAQDQLLDTVTELSAPGSELSAESMHTNDPAEEERLQERMRTMADQWRKHGFNLDLTGLIYFGNRTTAMSHLRVRGWDVTATSIGDLFAVNGFSSSTDDEKPFAEQLYISGTLTGSG